MNKKPTQGFVYSLVDSPYTLLHHSACPNLQSVQEYEPPSKIDPHLD